MWWIALLIVSFFVLIIIIGVSKAKKETAENNAVASSLTERGFTISKELHYRKVHFIIDDRNKQIFIKTKESPEGNKYNYQDVISFEVLENGKTLIKKSTGSAIVGGLLFGATGAIIGSTRTGSKDVCTGMVLNLIINDVINPRISIDLLDIPFIENNGVEKSDIIYKTALDFAKDVTSTLAAIQKQVENIR